MESLGSDHNNDDNDSPPSPSSPPTPTFKGRLNLSAFAFNPNPNSQPQPQPSSRPSTSHPPSTKKRNFPPDPPAPAPSPSPSTIPHKRARTPATYAPPSTYAHLPGLPDALAPNLLVLFVGLNPGLETARTGHAYAHPTNLFWRLLHSSRVTPRLCLAREYRAVLPALYSLGFTNIVARPTRNGGELLARELDAGVAGLEDKVRRWRPEAVCVVGKSIWEAVWRVRKGRGVRKEEFHYGWQDEGENMGMGVEDGEVAEGVEDVPGWMGARVFVATSTSGLAATPPMAEKERIWRELGVWVERRREEMDGADAEDGA